MLFVVNLTLATAPAVCLAGATYEVSYLWHHDLDQVVAYRQKVANVLGPRVTQQLKIVAGRKLYGLIYHRGGDDVGAAKVAAVHSRLLQSRGLDPAAPVPSRNWQFVGSENDSPSPGEQPAAVDQQDRAEEVRGIELAVENYIKQLRRQGKLDADERTAWSVLDFTTGEQLVSINEDIQLQAASLVKPFFALAFFHKVREGNLIYGPKSRRHMERMIQRSNNRSTNWILRHAGGPAAVQRILDNHYSTIFKDTRIVEYIPSNGRTYRNKASVNDYTRFLAALWDQQVPGAVEIKRLMQLPGPDRILYKTGALPVGTSVYNKTGSTSRLCGDMGILVVTGKDGRQYPYILVGVIEKQHRARNYTTWIRSRSNVIRKVSNIVYQGMSQVHDLPATL